jgi:hypothetical protein
MRAIFMADPPPVAAALSKHRQALSEKYSQTQVPATLRPAQ